MTLFLSEWILILVSCFVMGFLVYGIVHERREDREHGQPFEGFRGDDN